MKMTMFSAGQAAKRIGLGLAAIGLAAMTYYGVAVYAPRRAENSRKKEEIKSLIYEAENKGSYEDFNKLFDELDRLDPKQSRRMKADLAWNAEWYLKSLVESGDYLKAKEFVDKSQPIMMLPSEKDKHERYTRMLAMINKIKPEYLLAQAISEEQKLNPNAGGNYNIKNLEAIEKMFFDASNSFEKSGDMKKSKEARDRLVEFKWKSLIGTLENSQNPIVARNRLDKILEMNVIVQDARGEFLNSAIHFISRSPRTSEGCSAVAYLIDKTPEMFGRESANKYIPEFMREFENYTLSLADAKIPGPGSTADARFNVAKSKLDCAGAFLRIARQKGYDYSRVVDALMGQSEAETKKTQQETGKAPVRFIQKK